MERNMSRARRAFTEATKKRLKCWQAIFSKKPVRRCEPYSRRDVTAADPAAGARRIHDCGQGDSAWIATCLLSLVPSAPLRLGCARSEARRVGTECVSTGRSRGWPE